MKYDSVIIGSGLGGLACGITLSKEGQSVLVLEQGAVVGGCLQSFRRGGHLLDTGMHYAGSLLDGQILNQYFRYWDILDKVRLVEMDSKGFDEILYDDGSRFAYARGFEAFTASLSEHFPAQAKGIQTYCELLRSVGSLVTPEVLRSGRISDGGLENMGLSALEAMQSCISDTKLQEVLCGNDLLFGCPMESRSLYEHAMVNHSFIEGACSFAGGTQHWADAMAEVIRQHGGEIRLGAKVSKIHLDGDRADYVLLTDGERIECGRVISDIHPNATLALLDNNTILKKAYFTRMNSLKNSEAVFTLYLLLRPDSVKYTGRNYYMHCADGSKALLCMQPETGSDYVKTISVMTKVRYEDFAAWAETTANSRGAEYAEAKARKEEELLAMTRTFFPDIAAAVERTFSTSPLSWRDYTLSPDGSAYGIMKDYHNPMVTHIPARTKIGNLLLTGQNLNLHGALGVAVSSAVTCSEILGTEYLTKKIGNA